MIYQNWIDNGRKIWYNKWTGGVWESAWHSASAPGEAERDFYGGAFENLNATIKLTAAEIQLRAIAMDSWAALEHQLKYKRRIANQQLLVAGLKRCADEIASTDLSMQTLRQLICGTSSNRR